MCGRYSLFAPPDDIEDRAGATFAGEFEPRYNAAPRQSLPVVTDDAPETIQRLEWGLIPSWADDRSDHGHINARAETLSETASFSGAYERRRCLVLADGFYEWTDGGEWPYRVTVGGDLFAMAGLRERWEPPSTRTGLGDFGGGAPSADPDPVETFAIVTTEPNDLIGDLHHRMAVILSPDEEREWLTADPSVAADLLDPYPTAEMDAYRVSTAVNDPSNDAPEVVEPVEG